MPALLTRIAFLQAVYVLLVLAVSAWAASANGPLIGGLILVWILWRSRRWIRDWTGSRRALRGPWKEVSVGSVQLSVPEGWTPVELKRSAGESLSWEGKGEALVSVQVLQGESPPADLAALFADSLPGRTQELLSDSVTLGGAPSERARFVQTRGADALQYEVRCVVREGRVIVVMGLHSPAYSRRVLARIFAGLRFEGQP